MNHLLPALQHQRKLKEELEQLRLEIERAQRAGEYGKASELRYGRLGSVEAAPVGTR